MIKSTTNRYGDILLTASRKLEDYFEDGYDPSKGYIIHNLNDTNTNDTEDVFSDFKFIACHDGYSIYANEKVRKECPAPINGSICGSIMTLFVQVEKEIYLILVKDRTKKYITNPCGTRDSLTESFLECAIRETKEETSVEVLSATECGSYRYKHWAYEIQWPGKGEIFYTCVEMSKEDFEKALTFECDEIGKVYAIPITEMENSETLKLDDFSVSDHHMCAARFAKAKLENKFYDWESNKPKYMDYFELF